MSKPGYTEAQLGKNNTAMHVNEASPGYLARAGAQDVPPRFKRTDIGVIPEDWDVKLLPEVCRFRGGKAHEQFISELGQYVCVNSKFISTEGRERKYSTANFCRAKRDDILMVMSDLPNGRALAKAYLVEQNDLYAVNQRVCALTAYRDSPKYLFYVLNRNRYFLKFDDGVNQTHLLNNVFQRCPVVIPPSQQEQRAIAEALSDVDGLLAALDKLIAKKRAIKQAAMQQLLTGKTRLPGFSGEWETKRLGDVASIRNQKVLPSKVRPDTPCIELEHIGQEDGRLLGVSSAHNSTSTKYLFFAGDVLFGRLRSYLRKYWLADRDGICTTEIWPLMVVPEEVVSGFLYAIVQTEKFIEAASISYGTHMPRADWTVMRNFETSLPSLEEQYAIATVLADMDADIAALEARRDKTRALKQGMMQQLLTGRVRLVEPQAGAVRA